MSLQYWPVTLAKPVDLRSSCILSGRLPGGYPSQSDGEKLRATLLPNLHSRFASVGGHKTTDVVDFVQCAFGESSLWIRHSFLSV